MPIAEPIRLDVELSPLALEHVESTFQFIVDPSVRDNLGVRTEPSIERTRQWIENARVDESIRAYAILLAGVHVGNAVLDRIDPYLQTGRLSVYVGERTVRRGGIGRSACYRLLEEAFGCVGLRKVWLTVHVRNYAALRTYVRLGFSIEGVMREEFVLQGERIDAFLMSILRREFFLPERLR